MPRQIITIPEALYEALERYRQDNGLTMTQAIVKLTSESLSIDAPLPEHGGARDGAGKKSRETIMAGLTEAFEAFMADGRGVEDAIDSSTSAVRQSDSDVWRVELFRDGTYRALPGNQIGSEYKSSGLLIRIPVLSDDEIGEWLEEYNMAAPSFYDNAIEQLRRDFDYALSEYA